MPIEFLDEPAAASASGSEFLDRDEMAGVERLDGTPVSAGLADLEGRFSDPFYAPTLAEFELYRTLKAGEPVIAPSKWAAVAASAASQAFGDLVRGAKAAPALLLSPKKLAATLAEGVARGSYDLGMLGHSILGNIAALSEDLLGEGKFDDPELRQWLPEQTLRRAKEKYAQERKERDYDRFLVTRALMATRELARQGQQNLIGDVPVDQAVAEAGSYVLDPTALVTGGAGAIPRSGLSASQRVTAALLREGGRATKAAARALESSAELPGRLVGKSVEALTDSAEAAARAEKIVDAGSIGATLVSPALAVPGLTPVAMAIQGFRRTGQLASGVADVMSAVGRSMSIGPSRLGVLSRIVSDGAAPLWLRTSANAVRRFDTALALVGSAAESAAHGALVGTALGALSEGAEGAAGGFGAGGVLGAGFGSVGRLFSRRENLAQARRGDIARWLNSKQSEEIKLLRDAKLSEDDALRMADLERIAQGVIGADQGDVAFRYLSDADFRAQFGALARGAQLVEGDKPYVFVNLGYRRPGRSLAHEVMHALDQFDDLGGARSRINRLLFDATASDGTLINRGLYSQADLASFEGQYRARLGEAARAEWDLLSPEQRQARVMGEIRAEHFANLIDQSSPRFLTRDLFSLRGRLRDALLLGESPSFLHRLRRGLERAGVKFDSQGVPSALFQRHGRPITNSPEVNAALSDYLRAKSAITRRLIASEDETPSFVVRPQDLLGKDGPTIIEVFKDNDLFAKHPDGSVKFLGGAPVLLSESEIKLLQTKRVENMLEALERAPDAGDVSAMRKKENGAWEGRHFSDRQMQALNALPDDILSPSMKQKLGQLNEWAKGDGNQIVIDYNAALRGRKYSSGISSVIRTAVPLSTHISKAGNFYVTTLDTSHFFRKLGDWRKTRPKTFEAWSGDSEAFLRDVFTYLDNHAQGRPGATDLDADPARAVVKRNLINAFFNVPQGDDINPVRSLNRTGNRDNMIRARRFDRINRITPGAGDRFPVNYGLLKANFLPTDAIVTPNVLPQLNMFLEVRGPAEAWEIRELEKLTTESGALPSRLLSRNPDEGSYWVSITPRGEMHQVTYWYDHTDPIPIADVRVKSLNDAITVALESRFTHPKFIDPRIRMRYASHNEQTDERANSGRRAGVHEEPERGPTSRVSRTVESGKPFRVQRGDQIAGERAIRSQARQQAATDFAR
ncbi:MAG: hypothetical protein FJW38_28420, partial [Acidobacteria bacterium]|nr:hypothetical protein [Acidobacteriota bacterium]